MGTIAVDVSSTYSPQLNCPAMRNRIVSSSELVGLSTTDSVAEHSCVHSHSREVVDQYPVRHPVSLFGPERYEPRYQYPLFLWLHSCHSSELELEGVMPALSLQNYVGCAPRAPISSDREGSRFLWSETPSTLAVSEEIIFESIENAKCHFSIDSSRVFLAGFGSGASTALRIALRYPGHFAGVAAFCGRFPSQQCSLANLSQARSLPMLWAYGEHSENCGISQVCETLPMLHTAGLALDIRQYPCADELLSNMLTDANAWMMQLITQQPSKTLSTRTESFSSN